MVMVIEGGKSDGVGSRGGDGLVFLSCSIFDDGFLKVAA